MIQYHVVFDIVTSVSIAGREDGQSAVRMPINSGVAVGGDKAFEPQPDVVDPLYPLLRQEGG